MRRFHLELRPFGNACGKGCSHCYQPRRTAESASKPFDAFLLGAMPGLEFYLRAQGVTRLKVIFHGGDPILDGGGIVHRCVDVLRRELPALRLDIGIQSAGLLQEETVTFLITEGFQVGLSLSVTDWCFRRSTWDIALHSAITLAESRCLSSIQVVASPEAMEPEDAFAEMLRHVTWACPDGRLKVIPWIGPAPGHPADVVAYRRALHACVREGRWDVEPLAGLRSGTPVGCRFTGECGFKSSPTPTLCIDYDGAIFPCNRFAALRWRPLSHLNNDGWIAGAVTGLRSAMQERTCGPCAAQHAGCLGHAGCPFHALYHGAGLEAEDPFCVVEGSLVGTAGPS